MLDSGSTMSFLRRLYPEATMVVLVTRHANRSVGSEGGLMSQTTSPKEGASTKVWVAESLETDRWVLFPWSPAEDREAEKREAEGREPAAGEIAGRQSGTSAP